MKNYGKGTNREQITDLALRKALALMIASVTVLVDNKDLGRLAAFEQITLESFRQARAAIASDSPMQITTEIIPDSEQDN